MYCIMNKMMYLIDPCVYKIMMITSKCIFNEYTLLNITIPNDFVILVKPNDTKS